MYGLMLVLAGSAPLLMLPLAFIRSGRFLIAAAALPALAAALLTPAGTQLDLPWLLLGARLGLDAEASVFLLFSALLWIIAAAHAGVQKPDPRAVRFRVFFLLTMSGNFTLIVAQDLVSFYLGFALMGLAAYGLVAHDGSRTARRAARIYLVMTLVAELALLFGLLFLYWRTGALSPSPQQLAGAQTPELALLMLAFGVKAGVIGLHFWLPLAHPAAPVAASAVLSGAMIKTALIGWMRYLPIGQESLPEWGLLLVISGAAGALLAPLIGLMQTSPKVVLAYSSIGKMGVMSALLGFALIEPQAAPAIIAALTLFAAHHGLAKGALFLGVDAVKNASTRWTLPLLALPALALIGLPFTSGAFAKAQVYAAVLPLAEHGLLLWMLTITSLATALLMMRFLYLLRQPPGTARPVALVPLLPWLALLGLIVLTPLAVGVAAFSFKDVWPLALAALISGLLLMLRPPWLFAAIGKIPPGDILAPISRLSRLAAARLRYSRSQLRKHLGAGQRGADTHYRDRVNASPERAEQVFLQPAVLGSAWLLLILALLWLMPL
jgi:formate hydrogenlyase subunit 3/multisubunit Na+/H+ antiporter MnhD subunit